MVALLPRPADAAPIALLALGYAIMVLFGLNWSVAPGVGTPVWPAAGLALAVLLLRGPRLWPGVLLGRLLAAWLVDSPQPWWGDLLIAAGSAAGAALPLLLAAPRAQPPFGRLRDVIWLGAAAAGGATLSTATGAAVLALTGAPAGVIAAVAVNWWCGFAVGVLSLTAPIIAWARREAWRMRPARWLHLLAVLALTAATAAAVFTNLLDPPWRSWLLFPLLAWAAIAFDVRGASAALLIVAGLALAGAAAGTGTLAFLSPLPADRVLAAQQFVATAALTALALAAVADERRRFEPAARLGAIVQSSGEAIVGLSRDLRVQSWNAAAEALFGFRAAEIVGRTLPEFVALLGRPLNPALLPLLRRALAGERVSGEIALFNREHDLVPLAFTASPVRGVDGAIDGVASILRDLRGERAAAAALAEREERLRLVVRAGGIGCFDWDALTGRGRLSPEYLALYGVDGSEDPMAFERWMELVHPDDRARVREEIAAASACGAASMRNEHRIVRADDGETRWLFNMSELHRDSDGRVARVVGAQIDVTDRKRAELELQRLNAGLEAAVASRTAELLRAEEALRQSQKMEALGQLTGGVAHDFNNLLTPIVGGLDMLGRRLSEPRDQKLVAAALQSAERARVLVQRLLAFARRQTMRPEDVDLAAMVRSMADLLERTLGPRIVVALDLPPGLPPARVDRNQCELALLNLCVNARDAMPDGGRLRIAAALEPAALDGADALRLGVADSGAGMDADVLARAVDPFFSTKPVGKGTGLGLSMVHGMAAQSGGRLEIDSAPGQGTRVGILLPVGGGAAAAAAPPSTPAGAAPPLAVLLVDDEAEVRAATAAMLEAAGHAVAQAADGAAALRLLEGGRFDLLVTDQLMPGMTGAALARRARAQAPALKVLLVTGYAGGEGDAVADAADAVLTKPFRLDELAGAVAALVAPRATS